MSLSARLRVRRAQLLQLEAGGGPVGLDNDAPLKKMVFFCFLSILQDVLFTRANGCMRLQLPVEWSSSSG